MGNNLNKKMVRQSQCCNVNNGERHANCHACGKHCTGEFETTKEELDICYVFLEEILGRSYDHLLCDKCVYSILSYHYRLLSCPRQ